MRPAIKNTLLVGARKGVAQQSYNVPSHTSKNFCSEKGMRKIFNRSCLPTPLEYYREHFTHLPKYTDRQWIGVQCCFHEDKNLCLSISLISGGFYCFAGGMRGENNPENVVEIFTLQRAKDFVRIAHLNCNSSIPFFLIPAPRCVLARLMRAKHSGVRLSAKRRTDDNATL